jgi:hypothetical protein
MFGYDAVLAAALLTSPPVPAADALPWSDRFRLPLLRLALAAELLDEREAEGIFHNDIDFPADLQLLQLRCEELVNAPLLEESGRFPDRNAAKAGLALNRALRCELLERIDFDRTHGPELTHAAYELEHSYQVWEALREAGSPCYYTTVRRRALDRLRGLLGPEAFYRGQTPPPVPLWLLPLER